MVLSSLKPAAKKRRLRRLLAACESPNVTYAGEGFPLFIRRAKGSFVYDEGGRRYDDFTACFGVAFLGHNDAEVAAAVRKQMRACVHGMGDVHPPMLKVELLHALTEFLPWRGYKAILSTTGSEAMESAIKTALVATGREEFVAFEGAYHGLSMGALSLTHRPFFRHPFEGWLCGKVRFAPFPDLYRRPSGGPAGDDVRSCLAKVEELVTLNTAGVVIEPIQGRGGVRPAPAPFLQGLSRLCRRRSALLIADEVFTGFGRTGAKFACAAAGVAPDIIVVGKAMGNGFPISACLARGEIMDAWGPSSGEAVHTSTFLGHPIGCAAGLAVLEKMERERPWELAREKGEKLTASLRPLLSSGRVGEIRGEGLMVGIELVREKGKLPYPELAQKIVRQALKAGLILLRAGDEGNVLSLTPPVTITAGQIEALAAFLRHRLCP